VPGLAALNTAGDARVTSLSCWAVNDCAAGGYYTDRRGHSQAFVVAERNGRWDRAVQVPGLAALNKGGNAQVASVSCAPDGYCAAGGYYTDGSGHRQAFVVTRPRDRWRAAVEVPGSAALNTGGSAQVSSVSCPAAGECAAGGSYTASSGALGFVVSQANGVWGTAVEVPGLAALNTAWGALVESVSCGSAGNCAAGGSYDTFPYCCGGGAQGFVASEENGVWGTAVEVPGLAALNVGGEAQVTSVSCARGDYCAAGGTYTPYQYAYVTPFVASGSNGVWGTAAPWGILGGEDGIPSFTTSLSCPSAGSCVALGYTIPGAFWQPFVASQTNGAWGAAKYLPGVFAEGFPTSLSCPSAGNCGAGGYNLPRAYPGGGRTRPFVASETNGRWASAELYPGTLALNKGRLGQVTSVSCPSKGHCTAAGFYTDAKKHQQAFVGGP
jgi:hypothetical protein